MRLGVRCSEIPDLTLPAIQLLLNEASQRRSRVSQRAKTAKAWPVVIVGD